MFYISAYTTLNELLAVFFIYNNNNNNLTCKAPVCAKKTSVAVLLQFERSLNSYFVHNNYYYYYYYLQHLAFCYLFNIMTSLYVGLQI